MFALKARAYPSEALFGCSTLGQVLALPTNIRLGCKGFTRTNMLGFSNSNTAEIKSFIKMGTGAIASKISLSLD
jgi:hypothetical protein